MSGEPATLTGIDARVDPVEHFRLSGSVSGPLVRVIEKVRLEVVILIRPLLPMSSSCPLMAGNAAVNGLPAVRVSVWSGMLALIAVVAVGPLTASGAFTLDTFSEGEMAATVSTVLASSASDMLMLKGTPVWPGSTNCGPSTLTVTGAARAPPSAARVLVVGASAPVQVALNDLVVVTAPEGCAPTANTAAIMETTARLPHTRRRPALLSLAVCSSDPIFVLPLFCVGDGLPSRLSVHSQSLTHPLIAQDERPPVGRVPEPYSMSSVTDQ